jgi:PAS domain S-box-containing protein
MQKKNMTPDGETSKKQISEAIFDLAPIGIEIYDGNGRLVEVNRKCLELFGVSHVSSIKDFHLFEDPNISPENRVALKNGASVSYKAPFDFDLVTSSNLFPTSKSGKIHISVIIEPIGNLPDQPIEHYVVLVQDITEQIKSEKALGDSEQSYRLIAENTNDVLFKQNLDQSLIYVSPSAEKIFGYTVEEALLLAPAQLLTPQSLARVQESFSTMSVLAAGADVEVPLLELEYMRKDGSTFWGELHVSFLKDATGKLMGMQGVVRDITERKKTESMLINAQKLESLGILAGGIAHDFNNLLSGIFGNIDMAIGNTKEETTAKYMKNAFGVLDRARSLTQQLLTFSKGGSPVKKLENLTPFLENTVRFALSGSTISPKFDVPSETWPCDIDKNQIGQVIDNIVINAQQAMPAGGVIEVSAKNVLMEESPLPKLKGGSFVKISISDHGVGIPKDHLQMIFDPFFTTKTKGHGLGLATCYSIINRHGGYIDAESQPGIGSTFHVYLAASPGKETQQPTKKAISHKGSGTILLLDDEDYIRQVIDSMLSSLGYAVISRKSGEELVDLFKAEIETNKTLKGIIVDLTIPGGMGGIETLQAIRKIDGHVPVFVTSGYADDPAIADPGAYGFTASIRKPFTISELAEKLMTPVKP